MTTLDKEYLEKLQNLKKIPKSTTTLDKNHIEKLKKS